MSSMHGIPFAPRPAVNAGLIGCGGRGRWLLGDLLACDGVEIRALADIQESAVQQALAQVSKAKQPDPRAFWGADALRRLLEISLDVVYIATPWDTHAPYAVAVMEAGKHAAVEVPAAIHLEECWRLVETSERTRQHCIMLENCCYDYWEMLVKRMVQAGLLGTIVHAECAYIHDLRAMLFEDTSEGLWRRIPQTQRNGNHYPTHGLGPVAQILEIGSQDAFDYLVSMSSRSVGLAEYRDRTLNLEDTRRKEKYIAGDINLSLIRTKLGKTIVLQHSTVLPRPYDRIFLVSGTRGTFRDYPPRLYLEGAGREEEWLPLDEYRQKWEYPLWREVGELARQRGGHGGMDYLMNYRLVQTMRLGLPPDSDVYDAAEWSAPGPLSEMSVAQRSAVVDFPDFRNHRY
jgi:predicted dehydrogenase